MAKTASETKPKSTTLHKIATAIGILFCLVLVPLLALNVTVLVQGYLHPDEVPGVFGYMPLIVTSNSMEKVIYKGDIIFVKAVADAKDLETLTVGADGTIVTFYDYINSRTNERKVVTHRLIAVADSAEGEGVRYTSKGDNNKAEDPRPLPVENIIGTYLFRIPKVGSLALFMQTVPGMLVFIAVPLILLLAYDLLRRRIFDKQQLRQQAQLQAQLEEMQAKQTEQEEHKEKP